MPAAVRTLSPAMTLQEACTNLARVVCIEAEAMARLTGFGWQGDPQAPADYRSLLTAYARSQATGCPLPVSSDHNHATIYSGAPGNLAFRFWHDVTHVRLARGFDLDGEIEVALAQLDVLRALGFRPGSLEFELLHADTLGQTLCGAATGNFPHDQLCFARSTIGSSLAQAIRAQLEPRLFAA